MADEGIGDGQRMVGIITGAVGLASAGVGTWFAFRAQSTFEESDRYCRDNDVCYDEGLDKREQAYDQATLATIGIGVGAVAVVGGAMLWLTAPSVERPASADRRAHLSADVRPGGGRVPWSVSIRGEW